MLEQTGSATLADNIEVVRRRQRPAHLRHARRVGRRRGAGPARQVPGRPGRPGPARAGDPRRRPGPPVHQRGVRRPRRRRRALGPVLRRRRPALRAPAAGRPQRAGLPQLRRLPRRAAGRVGAHRLGRRRADPGGGDRHRDVRDQPEPGADRRRAGRLGAQPGDRDRRGGRRRPRQRDRPLRRRAAVLPDGPRHPRGRGPQAGGPRLLRRADQQDPGRGAARAPRRRRSRPGWSTRPRRRELDGVRAVSGCRSPTSRRAR